MTVTIRKGDCREILRELPEESVHCVVTSPPYWGLRDYGMIGQFGLEPDFRNYVAAMVGVFREVRRVLRKDGTLWLNLGDSYANTRGGKEPGLYEDKRNAAATWQARVSELPAGLKPKDLCGVPWRVAFALQADGWYLRQDIIWSKPNPMPESVTDRCTKSHEYLFLLSKSERYYYDAEAIAEQAFGRMAGNKTPVAERAGSIEHASNGRGIFAAQQLPRETRNKRSVWEVATQPFGEAHFATFPPALIEPCIKAGTSERGCCAKCGAPWVRETEKGAIISAGGKGERYHAARMDGRDLSDDRMAMTARETMTLGWSPSCKCDADAVPCTVLDPFAGAGTTGLVADRLQRSAILIELNPTYADMSQRRIKDDAPLFAAVNDYNAEADFAKSIEEAYRVIRERKAAGGKGWEPP